MSRYYMVFSSKAYRDPKEDYLSSVTVDSHYFEDMPSNICWCIEASQGYKSVDIPSNGRLYQRNKY
jgi:hypothetical protein